MNAPLSAFPASIRSAHTLRGLLAASLFMVLNLSGCGEGGGGGGAPGSAGTTNSTSVDSVIAVEAIRLAPGIAAAAMAWTPSEGRADTYFVFESRNGEPYLYSQATKEAQAVVTGHRGDRVQITVVGVSPSGEMSESSPPSLPMIFHKDTAAVASRARPSFEEAVRLAEQQSVEAQSVVPRQEAPRPCRSRSPRRGTTTPTTPMTSRTTKRPKRPRKTKSLRAVWPVRCALSFCAATRAFPTAGYPTMLMNGCRLRSTPKSRPMSLSPERGDKIMTGFGKSSGKTRPDSSSSRMARTSSTRKTFGAR